MAQTPRRHRHLAYAQLNIFENLSVDIRCPERSAIAVGALPRMHSEISLYFGSIANGNRQRSPSPPPPSAHVLNWSIVVVTWWRMRFSFQFSRTHTHRMSIVAALRFCVHSQCMCRHRHRHCLILVCNASHKYSVLAALDSHHHRNDKKKKMRTHAFGPWPIPISIPSITYCHRLLDRRQTAEPSHCPIVIEINGICGGGRAHRNENGRIQISKRIHMRSPHRCWQWHVDRVWDGQIHTINVQPK